MSEDQLLTCKAGSSKLIMHLDNAGTSEKDLKRALVCTASGAQASFVQGEQLLSCTIQ